MELGSYLRYVGRYVPEMTIHTTYVSGIEVMITWDWLLDHLYGWEDRFEHLSTIVWKSLAGRIYGLITASRLMHSCIGSLAETRKEASLIPRSIR